MERCASSQSPSTSSQLLVQIRTDTDTSSIHNNSSLDRTTKSLSITAAHGVAPSSNRTLATTTTTAEAASANINASHHTVGFVSDPSTHQKSQGLHSPSHRMSSSNFPVSNNSMSFSSVDDTRNPPVNLNTQQSNYMGGGGGGRSSRRSPPQRRHSGDNSVMDAVSRSLNAHNDPELEGLPPMGDESSAEGSTLLYEKGFLISTSPGADREPGVSHPSSRDCLASHLQDEEHQHQQQQQQHQQKDNSVSHSRGQAGSASGISHRFLTAEEIEERRRATSRPVSQAPSRAQPGAVADANKSTNNNSVSLSASGKPPHRQLSKEETEKLIAQRQQQFKEQEKQKQQQRAAAAAAVAAAHSTAPGDSSATGITTTASASHQPNTPAQPRMAPTNNANTNSTNAASSAPLNSNATPWLLAGDGSQATLLHGQQQPHQQQQQQQPPSTAGGGAVAFEWLSGASTGVGGLMNANPQTWVGGTQWRDAATAGGAGAISPAFFPGAAMGGGGSGAEFGEMANIAAGTANGGAYMWLPNTSYWTSLEQQTQQQQQEQQTQQQQQQLLQSALIPSMAAMAATPHDAFPFSPNPPIMLSAANPLGTSSNSGPATVGVGVNVGGGGLAFAGPLAGLTLSLLQSLPLSQIEAGIRQCDEQLVRAQHDRELLYHELQRRQYPMVSSSGGGTTAAANANNISVTSGGAAAATTESMSWPGALHNPLTAANAAAMRRGANNNNNHNNTQSTTGGPASTGSPSRFFNGPGVEELPRTLDVPNSVIHTVAGLNFSTAASGGGASMSANAHATGTSERRNSGSDGSAAAPTGGPLSSKSAGAGAAAAAAAAAGKGTHELFNKKSSSSTASRGHRHGGRSRGHSSAADKYHHTGRNNNNNNNNNNASASFGATGGPTSTGNRCSHDNTPQEQKYLQTDPFSMYEHNKKIATTAATAAAAPAASLSSKDATA